MIDTFKLKMYIMQSNLKLKNVAEKLGITPYSLYKKMNNLTEFKASEIGILIKLLDLDDIGSIFFVEYGDLKSTKCRKGLS